MDQDFSTPPEDLNDPLSLEHLEKQLDDLEYLELSKSMTDDDLKERGLLVNGSSNNSFTGKKFTTDKEQLVFDSKIDFYRVDSDITFDKLQLEDYLFVKNTESKALIATRKNDQSVVINAGENVLQTNENDTVCFYARVCGKVLILKNTLCILPADSDCKVIINISDDRLKAHADLFPGFGNGKTLTCDFVKEKIIQAGITFGILDNEIENAVQTVANHHKSVKGIPIAQGAESVSGRDGYVQYDFETESKEYGFTILPDGRIDYRNIKNIPMVKKDARVARIIEPKTGVKGTDIFGKAIEPKLGKTAVLIAGNGVHVSEDHKEYFASIDGTIVLNGSLIEVMDSYIVQGDVDYSTGNISFTGNVLVNGTVLEGFEIKAGGDIIVAKNVESARMEAGRDIIIVGGILGKGKGLISASRDIKVGYVQNARLEAQGDIIIKNFAVNSYLFTSKNLILKEQRGSLIGGEAYAQKSIDLKHLGSPAGTKTYVEAGTDYLLKRKLVELDDIIQFCEQNIAKIDQSLKSVAHDAIKNKEILSTKQNLIKKAIEKKAELENRLKIISIRKADLQDQLFIKDTCFIKIRDNCYTDVTIKIRDKKIKTDTRRSNITIQNERCSDSLVITSY
jgi:uncharacterized protein (DUF342 family)